MPTTDIIFTLIGICLLALLICLLFVKLNDGTKKLASMQSQITATELLSSDMQINLSTLHHQLEQLEKKLSDTEIEFDQVTKQLEHRIKSLQNDNKALSDIVNKMAEQQPQDKFYTRANKLAALGADVEEIMAECELPRAEVEMLLAIHKNN